MGLVVGRAIQPALLPVVFRMRSRRGGRPISPDQVAGSWNAEFRANVDVRGGTVMTLRRRVVG